MAKRKGLSKLLRFEVFKRDKFTCQYCGKRAPDVVLNADHIEPVAMGGGDDITNLLTACADCNAGKSDKPLGRSDVLEKQRQQLELLAERREQLDMMLQWQKELVNLDHETCDELAQLWSELVPGWHLNDKGMVGLNKLVQKHGAAVVAESIRKSAAQYVEFEGDPPKATSDSVNKAWDYVHRIARYAKENAERPWMKDLYYVRGIVRNRFTYCQDWVALKLLKEAYEAGIDIDRLKDMAKSAGSWGDWQDEMFLETEAACTAKQGSR